MMGDKKQHKGQNTQKEREKKKKKKITSICVQLGQTLRRKY
jgi:hypothetical protein